MIVIEKKMPPSEVQQLMLPELVREGSSRGWDGMSALTEWEGYLPPLPAEVADNELVVAAIECFSVTLKLSLHRDHLAGRVSQN